MIFVVLIKHYLCVDALDNVKLLKSTVEHIFES